MTPRRASSSRASKAAAPSLFDAPLSDDSIYQEVGESFPGASPASAIAVSTLTQTVKDVVNGRIFLGRHVAQLGFALQLEGTEEFVLHRCHRVAVRIGTFDR